MTQQTKPGEWTVAALSDAYASSERLGKLKFHREEIDAWATIGARAKRLYPTLDSGPGLNALIGALQQSPPDVSWTPARWITKIARMTLPEFDAATSRLELIGETTSSDGATIQKIDEKVYQVAAEKFRVTDAEDAILTAFLEMPAMNERELIDRSGYSSARKILRDLPEKYPAMSASIRLPKRKSTGGYSVRIVDRQKVPE